MILGYSGRKYQKIMKQLEINNNKVIKAVWLFKCKQNPVSKITKYKVRIYTHRDMQ